MGPLTHPGSSVTQLDIFTILRPGEGYRLQKGGTLHLAHVATGVPTTCRKQRISISKLPLLVIHSRNSPHLRNLHPAPYTSLHQEQPHGAQTRATDREGMRWTEQT